MTDRPRSAGELFEALGMTVQPWQRDILDRLAQLPAHRRPIVTGPARRQGEPPPADSWHEAKAPLT